MLQGKNEKKRAPESVRPFAVSISGGCNVRGTHRTQYYDLLIRENRYPEALHLVLADLERYAR